MAIVAGRARGRHRLLRALLCAALALCAGCGSSFEEGDEAWIRVPGEVLLLDEYIVVEVDRFADRGVEVEPEGSDYRKPIFPELAKLASPGKLISELDEDGSEYVDADQLINPDEAEDAYEDTMEIANLIIRRSLIGEGPSFDLGDLEVDFNFIAEEAGDIEEFQSALEMAERLDLDEAVLALRMIIETLESHSEVADEDLAEDSPLDALVAYREWVEGIRDIMDDDEDRFRDRFKAFSQITAARESDEDRLKVSDKDRLKVMDVAFQTALAVGQSALGKAGRLPNPIGEEGAELTDMIARADGLIKLSGSYFEMVTMDGEIKFGGERLKKWIADVKDEVEQTLGRALVDSIDVQKAESLDDVEDAYSGLNDIADEFRDELDLKLLSPKTEIRLHERAANSFSERIELALENGDFDGAAAASRGYMDVQGALASLKARHGKSNNRQAYLDRERERLASRLDSKLREGAMEVAISAARRGEAPDAIVERVREWAKPFSEALGVEALDEDFLRGVREQGELAIRRGVVRVGQVWMGWIQCQEAADLRRYKDDEGGRRGPLYHGVDRMEAKLELIEAQGGDHAVMRFQGLLTAQNLPAGNKWRQWDPEAKAWTNSEKESSSQFAVLTYRPALLTLNLDYGVLDRGRHVEKYGQSEHWVREVNGAWHYFRGRGSIDLDEGTISGKMTRRYIDDTCATFRFTLGDASPGPEADSDSQFPQDAPSGPGPSAEATATPGETSPSAGPPVKLASETYIGGVKSRGLQMYGLSATGDWCAENVVFKMKAESADVFADGTAKFFVKRFGEQINQPQYCPFARAAEIYGYDSGDQLVFTGTASASDGWTVR